MAAALLRSEKTAGNADLRERNELDVSQRMLIALQANERGVDGDIVKATLSKALMVVGLWLLHPVLSHQFQDYCVYVLLAWPYLGILMGLFYVKEVGKWLANGCTSDPLTEPILKGE